MSYEEMVDLWRSKLFEARARHSAAVKKYEQVFRDYKEGLFAPPDGWVALQQAHRDEMNALEEYMRVLMILHNLMVRGQQPPEV